MTHTPSDPWTIDPAAFPHDGSFDQQARHLISYATLAPSGHNTQPWLFTIGTDRIDLYADRRRALPVVDPHDRELAISCGAALGLLEVAAIRFGYAPTITLQPDATDPDLLARIDLGKHENPTPASTTLFDAIPLRRTARSAFSSDCPDDAIITACTETTKTHGVTLTIITDTAQRGDVAQLVAKGDRLQFDNPSFRRELAAWVHSSRLGSRDGMSGASFGMPDILSAVGSFVIRTFDLGNGVAATNEKKITSATPVLAILSTPSDTQDDWLKTGQALSDVLLTLTDAKFTASYLNQPIEVDSLRPDLAKIAQITGYPQILLRVGRTETIYEPTARRDISDVIQSA